MDRLLISDIGIDCYFSYVVTKSLKEDLDFAGLAEAPSAPVRLRRRCAVHILTHIRFAATLRTRDSSGSDEGQPIQSSAAGNTPA